ncbi:MAG: polysaccharide deacetylase family protein [Campylobacterales bacterium]|nr:polysaccharide deacetylase family protein [Campylobacterales bacterium]
MVIVFILSRLLLLILLFFGTFVYSAASIPILCYHRFGIEVKDSMTIKIQTFKSQLEWLRMNGYTVISLDTAARYIKGEVQSIPFKSIVITVDDGHKSVYIDMLPLIIKYKFPITLFIYPSAISNATYAMTWEQLRQLEETKLFQVESHTYWHPNFKKEKQKLSAEEYEKFVTIQLVKSKSVLEKKMGHSITYLAWSFGIYDDDLLKKAQSVGYEMAFSIDHKNAKSMEPMMAQPRYMIIEGYDLKRFESICSGKEDK